MRKAKSRLTTAGVGSVWRKIEHQRERLLDAAPDSIEQDIQKATQAPSTMRTLRSQLKKTAGKLQETAPQLTIAGGGLFMTLNNWGLVPESDVLPLEQFNRVWQPDEPDRYSVPTTNDGSKVVTKAQCHYSNEWQPFSRTRAMSRC